MAEHSGLKLDINSSNNLLLDETFEKSPLFLLNNEENNDDNPRCQMVKPLPGFCIKLLKDTGEKFFINMCHTGFLQPPKNIDDHELLSLMYGNDSGPSPLDNFRVPMSIGRIHNEYDKSGKPCEVCDVIINTDFYKNKVLVNTHFKTFIITLAVEGVSDKYNVNIDREKEPIVMKHCKFRGKIENQNIQIREVRQGQSEQVNSVNNKKLIEEITTNERNDYTPHLTAKSETMKENCPYQIFVDDAETTVGDKLQPKSITMNALVEQLKGLQTNSKQITLDISEDRLILRTAKDNIYCSDGQILLDVFLPFNVIREESTAHFNTDNKVLTVHMPVVST